MSDGKQMEAIIAPASGVREPITEESLKMIEIGEGIVRNRTHVAMDGMGYLPLLCLKYQNVLKSLLGELLHRC